MSPVELAIPLTLGLLGSAHCVGMCGGFVALLSAGSEGRASSRQAAYFAGKTATYAVFGLLAGAAGASLADLFGALGGTLSVVLGSAMVLVGASLCGLAWRGASAPGATVAARLGPAIGRLVQSGSLPSIAGLGALNGLLPCGLVYGMLAVAAASGSALEGALTMAVFGLATVPALAVTGWLGSRLKPQNRLWMQRIAGVLVIAMGVLTVARGATALTAGTPDRAEHVLCLPGHSGESVAQ
ncbi:MAG: sulfite exporter TauE/SafE family protein [Bacteroidota bacterium]